MAKVMKCDRCGKIYELYEDDSGCNQMSIGFDECDDYISEYVWDLCPECLKAAFEFINGDKKDTDEKPVEEEKESNIRLDILKAIDERMCNMFNVNPTLNDTIHSVIFQDKVIYERDILTDNYIFRNDEGIVLTLPFNCSHKDIVLMIKAEEELYEKK